MGILNQEDCQIVFSDTPGVLKPCYKLQESMRAFGAGFVSGAAYMTWAYDGDKL